MTAKDALELAKLIRPDDAPFLIADEQHSLSAGVARVGSPDGVDETHYYCFYLQKGRNLSSLAGSELCWEEALAELEKVGEGVSA